MIHSWVTSKMHRPGIEPGAGRHLGSQDPLMATANFTTKPPMLMGIIGSNVLHHIVPFTWRTSIETLRARCWMLGKLSSLQMHQLSVSINFWPSRSTGSRNSSKLLKEDLSTSRHLLRPLRWFGQRNTDSCCLSNGYIHAGSKLVDQLGNTPWAHPALANFYWSISGSTSSVLSLGEHSFKQLRSACQRSSLKTNVARYIGWTRDSGA
jgi:hypothetical protein